MIEIIAVIAITAVLGHALGMNVTDAIHAVNGTESPRMQKFAARRDTGTEDRRGFGRYWDEAWEAAAARRRKTIDKYGYKPGPMAWLTALWTAGWAKAINRFGPASLRPQQPEPEPVAADQDALGAPSPIDAELETTTADCIDEAFDSIPRTAQPVPAEPAATDDAPEPVEAIEIEVPVMPQWEGGETTPEHWSPFDASPPEPDDDEKRFLELSMKAVREHGLAVDSKDYQVFMLAHTRFGGDFTQAEAEYERHQQELADRKAAYAAADCTGLSGKKYRQFVESYLRFDGDFDRAYRSAFPEAFTSQADDDGDLPEVELSPEERFPKFTEHAERERMHPRAVDAILDALHQGIERIELPREFAWDKAGAFGDSYVVHENGRRVEAVVVPSRERPSDAASDLSLSDNEPMNTNLQEESMSNTSGETATLPTAQRYGNAMVEQLGNAIVAAEQSRASLAGAEVTGEPIQMLNAAMDQLIAAQTAFANFVAELARHQAVADAHRAVASAGGKQYLLGD